MSPPQHTLTRLSHAPAPAPALPQSWGDEDIPDMLAFMEERLKVGIQELSSYDKYKKEVLSGCLDWTPMHTSELFWRQNVQQFEDKDFQILRVLLKLIESSREVSGTRAAAGMTSQATCAGTAACPFDSVCEVVTCWPLISGWGNGCLQLLVLASHAHA
jgi:hypothetical protein